MTFWLGLFGLIAILALWFGHDWIPAAMFPFGVAYSEEFLCKPSKRNEY
jgi:hypothetical protein